MCGVMSAKTSYVLVRHAGYFFPLNNNGNNNDVINCLFNQAVNQKCK